MCVIVGFTQKGRSREEVLGCLDRAYTRGPDMARVEGTPSGWLGFRRLSIMGPDVRGMQPFALGRDRVVCNGELYGWKEQRAKLEQRGYAFHSGSDCEILLPLYREYGLEMFSQLDAEFALILYDGEADEYIAARDPMSASLTAGASLTPSPVIAAPQSPPAVRRRSPHQGAHGFGCGGCASEADESRPSEQALVVLQATRKPMDEELAVQMPIVKEVLDALGIVRCELAGYEADDLLGTISRRANENGDECVILTGDRDSLQLVGGGTVVRLVKSALGKTTACRKSKLAKRPVTQGAGKDGHLPQPEGRRPSHPQPR